MKLNMAVVLVTLGLVAATAEVSPKAEQTVTPDAERMHAVQLFLQARDALLHVEIGSERDVLLGIVGLDLAKIRQTADARQTLNFITADESRDVYLRPFLQVLLEASELGEAQRTVASMRTLGG